MKGNRVYLVLTVGHPTSEVWSSTSNHRFRRDAQNPKETSSGPIMRFDHTKRPHERHCRSTLQQDEK